MSSSFDAVLKVGGSLSRGESLMSLCQAIGELGARYRLLVVPGGGEYADLARAHYRTYKLGETTAHRMAILAMDQYGCLLGDLLPGSSLVTDLPTAREQASRGGVPVLLPAALFNQVDPLPHSWQVTSDSIAAWVAGTLGAPRLILLKDVDGLHAARSTPGEPPALIEEMTTEALADHRGGVDEYLATVLAKWSIETWVINGGQPQRLAELLATGRTLGTHITRG